MTAESVLDFPELLLQDLRTIALGDYQIKQARSYYAKHIRVDGMYELQVCIHAKSVFWLGIPCARMCGSVHARP